MKNKKNFQFYLARDFYRTQNLDLQNPECQSSWTMTQKFISVFIRHRHITLLRSHTRSRTFLFIFEVILSAKAYKSQHIKLNFSDF